MYCPSMPVHCKAMDQETLAQNCYLIADHRENFSNSYCVGN